VKQTRHESVESAPDRPPTEDHAAKRHALSLRVASCGTPNRPEADADHDLSHNLMAVRLSCPATFRRAGPLCLSLPPGCSQSHAVLGCLLIRRPHTPLKFTSDHTGLYLLTRERLQSSDVFLRPRTQSRSLRHLFSLSSCRPSVAVSKQKRPRICGALAPLYSITSNTRITWRCG
jgi:hypothetical protein